jgi:hypothetical protein
MNRHDTTFPEWLRALVGDTPRVPVDPAKWWQFYEDGMSPTEALDAREVLRGHEPQSELVSSRPIRLFINPRRRNS